MIIAVQLLIIIRKLISFAVSVPQKPPFCALHFLNSRPLYYEIGSKDNTLFHPTLRCIGGLQKQHSILQYLLLCYLSTTFIALLYAFASLFSTSEE